MVLVRNSNYKVTSHKCTVTFENVTIFETLKSCWNTYAFVLDIDVASPKNKVYKCFSFNKVVRFPTFPYAFLYLRSQNFHQNGLYACNYLAKSKPFVTDLSQRPIFKGQDCRSLKRRSKLYHKKPTKFVEILSDN